MRTTRGRFRGKIICFRQSRADESRWYILLLPGEDDGTEGGDEANTTHGIILVYVDDLLIAAVAALAREVSRMFQEKWHCTEPEWASVTGEVKFNGFEIRTTEGGLEIHQDSYIQDLLARRDGYHRHRGRPCAPGGQVLEHPRERREPAGQSEGGAGACRRAAVAARATQTGAELRRKSDGAGDHQSSG